MRSSFSAGIVTFVSLVAIVFLVYRSAHPPWTPLRIAGLIITLPAFVLLTTAQLQLGSSFSLTPQARHLVTHGIYSRIRNPIYVFSTLVLIGLVLFLDRPYLFLFVLVIVPSQLFRAALKLASSNNISATNTANTSPTLGSDRSLCRLEFRLRLSAVFGSPSERLAPSQFS